MSDSGFGTLLGLLGGMVETESSDLHLVSGYQATRRTNGRLKAIEGPVLDDKAIRIMVESVLPEPARRRLGVQKSVDCSISVEHSGQTCRFRLNVFQARGSLGACFRYVPEHIPTLEWMGFPAGLAERIVNLHSGLVVITGVTGSGKTTTLAALIDLMNQRSDRRIITVEEPIEYVFSSSGRSLITQREVGVDVDSFYDGLVSGLRQDPDVVLVGEIRDSDTARMAVSAAETGHLILTTLHTQDAKGALTRLVDLFPHDAQDDVRCQLSLSLRFVLGQHLLPAAKENERRALALEVLVASQPVRSAIRTGKIESIESAIQTGGKDGMVTLDESLATLATRGRITWDTARKFAKYPDSISNYANPSR